MMEININNAFPISVKVSLGPFLIRSRLLTKPFEELSRSWVQFLLQRPLFTTIILTNLLLLLVIPICFVIFVLLGVLTIVVFTIILEGFIIMLFLATVSIIVSIIGTTLTIIFGLQNSIYSKSDFEEIH